MKTVVPPVPHPPSEPVSPGASMGKASPVETGPASKSVAPLPIMSFLGRSYIVLTVCGLLMGAVAAQATSSAQVWSSLMGGYLLSALLLWGHQVVLSRVFRPRRPDEISLPGLDTRLLGLLWLPAKLVVACALLALWNASGTMEPAPMTLGFFVAQIVFFARLGSWILTQKRPGRA